MSLGPICRLDIVAPRPPSPPHQSRPLFPSTSARVADLVEHALTVLEADRGGARHYLSVASSLLTDGPHTQPRKQTSAERRCRLTRWQANRVIEYVESKLESKLCVEDLATLVSLSKSHFSRAFRQSMGMSPMAYVRGRRIEWAKTMISSTERPLCQIALACGFVDQSHLTRCFRRLVGRAPSRYRRIQACGRRDLSGQPCS
jgi:AraC family transcriptional regulator